MTPMNMSGYTVSELAGLCDGRAEGDVERRITGVASPEGAKVQHLVFADSEKSERPALESAAGCVIVSERTVAPGRTLIRHSQPKLAFARLSARLHPAPRPAAGVHPQAVVDPSAKIGVGVSIGPWVAIGADVVIGANTIVEAGCSIGDGCRIGEDCRLYPRVTLYPGVAMGHGVIIHAGAVIGADGFGYVFNGKSYEKFPQVGAVEIGDDVEIGANATVDRSALGVTRVGSGVKIDNLVQVGHNVRIGEHVVIASQTGISGSVEIGHHAIIAGQVGLADHVRIESGAVLGAQCGVPSNKVIRRGEPVWGTPARPIKEYLKQLAILARLTRVQKERS
jgi:UDP-3-O-[3-hydroxymyristoyl] glucosamine N-acyltransferase